LSKYLKYYKKCLSYSENKKNDFYHNLFFEAARRVAEGPLVSIIMPTYNAAATVELALKSLLSQSWKNLQIVVVDDASTDNTIDLVISIMVTDARIILLRNPVNVGPYVSRNLGMSCVTGKWVTTHDADDLAVPDRIERQVHELLASGAIAGTGSMLRIDKSGYVTRSSKVGPTSSDGYLRFCFVSLMIQTNFFHNNLGAWDSVRVGGDAEMIARIKSLGVLIHHIDEPLMLCLDHEQGLTNHSVLGLLQEDGLANDIRSTYATQYALWHRNGFSKKLSLRGTLRPFHAPEQLSVKSDDIEMIFNHNMR
jgi:glycosyltransferase involved in cell wall biosynthesis